MDVSLDKVIEFHKAMAKKQYYTADAKAYPKASMNKVIANGKLDPKAELRPGIALAEADMRVLPVAAPLYTSQASALGRRGLLKLDAMQNSTMKPGEPLAILGASKDSSWLFVATGSVVGWVPSNKVTKVGAEFMNKYLSSSHSVVVKDNARVLDSNGKRLCTLRLGTLLPVFEDGLAIPTKGKDGMAAIMKLKPEQGVSAPFPMPFTPRNAVSVIDELMGEPYGWGGSGGYRDCSAMTRDYFAVFGTWLPRNSADQARTGVSIPLKEVPVGERPRAIKENAIPFATLIHMPGHIMLYLGFYGAEPVVFHNAWGVRVNSGNGQAGRAVIGKAAVTSLKAGAEIKNRPASSLFIDKIAMLVFPADTAPGGR
jgi:cell wall-associated NlpC family hydrolase